MNLPDRMVVFSIAGTQLAVPAAAVSEILAMAAVSKSPNLPSFVEGFLNLRGNALPVLRLDRLLGLPDSPPTINSRLLILRQPGAEAALLVTDVERIFTTSAGELLPLEESDSFHGCIHGLLRLGQKTCHLLDPSRVLLEAEHRRLEEFRELEQQRLAGLAPLQP